MGWLKHPHNIHDIRTQQRVLEVHAHNLTRIKAVVAYMDARVGHGWKRRMEKVDHVMDQDLPILWLTGRRTATEPSLIRFEHYAARFGYDIPVPFRTKNTPVYAPDVTATLDSLLS